VNDDIFTNLAAGHNLRSAAEAAHRQPDLARSVGVTFEETAAWRNAVNVPYDADLRVHQQCVGFTRLPEWDFEAHRDRYPLLLHAPYFDLYRRQVIKQAAPSDNAAVLGQRPGATTQSPSDLVSVV
jgi:trehalose/maltose hydrolase-like predicted phosphorylase